MIVVLDTNIVASATYWRGKPAHCLEAWVSGKYDLAISHPILSEYEEVLARLGPWFILPGDVVAQGENAIKTDTSVSNVAARFYKVLRLP